MLSTLNNSKSAYASFKFTTTKFFSRYSYSGTGQFRERFYCTLYIRVCYVRPTQSNVLTSVSRLSSPSSVAARRLTTSVTLTSRPSSISVTWPLKTAMESRVASLRASCSETALPRRTGCRSKSLRRCMPSLANRMRHTTGLSRHAHYGSSWTTLARESITLI